MAGERLRARRAARRAKRLRSAAVGCGALALIAGGWSVATPSDASSDVPVLPGQVVVASLPGGTPATGAAAVTGGRTSVDDLRGGWGSVSTTVACPADTAQLTVSVTLPDAALPQEQWPTIALVPPSSQHDANNVFWSDDAPALGDPTILAHVAAALDGVDRLPLTAACHDAAGETVGAVEAILAIAGPDATTLLWGIGPVDGSAVTATVTATAPAAPVEVTDTVPVVVTLAPADATGTVAVYDGETKLGSADLSAGTATVAVTGLAVGTHLLQVRYLGVTPPAESVLPSIAPATADVTVQVVPAADRPTSVELAVDAVAGPANQPVTLTARLGSTTGDPLGTVTFYDGATAIGAVPVAAGTPTSLTTTVLGAGDHVLSAQLTGQAPYLDSTSAPITVSYSQPVAAPGDPAGASVSDTTAGPAGAIWLTSPYDPEHPLDLGDAVLDPGQSSFTATAAFDGITITDGRTGAQGFSATVVCSPFTGMAGTGFGAAAAGVTGLSATSSGGAAADAVVLTDRPALAPGLSDPQIVASYPAGLPLGSLRIGGLFSVSGVPTSTPAGRYSATLTVTAG